MFELPTLIFLQSQEVSAFVNLVKDVGVPIVFSAVLILAVYVFAKRAGPAFQTLTAAIEERSAKTQAAMMDLYRERLEASEKRASEESERNRLFQEKSLEAQHAQGTRHQAMLEAVLATTKAAMESQASKHQQEMSEVTGQFKELVGASKTQTEVLRDLSREVQRNTKP